MFPQQPPDTSKDSENVMKLKFHQVHFLQSCGSFTSQFFHAGFGLEVDYTLTDHTCSYAGFNTMSSQEASISPEPSSSRPKVSNVSHANAARQAELQNSMLDRPANGPNRWCGLAHPIFGYRARTTANREHASQPPAPKTHDQSSKLGESGDGIGGRMAWSGGAAGRVQLAASRSLRLVLAGPWDYLLEA